jgi:hypothetical protein
MHAGAPTNFGARVKGQGPRAMRAVWKRKGREASRRTKLERATPSASTRAAFRILRAATSAVILPEFTSSTTFVGRPALRAIEGLPTSVIERPAGLRASDARDLERLTSDLDASGASGRN